MDVKERIKEKAFEMFLKFGIRSVSMDEIAGQLGMSKKTLYQHFSEKNELVEAVVVEDIRHDQEDCLNVCTKAGNAVEEVFLIIRFVMKQLREMNPMVLYDLQKFHPTAFSHFERHKEEFMLKMVKENMERGIKEELYREDLNIDILSRFRLETMFIPFNMNAFPSGKYNVADVTREIMEHFIFGIATPKGYKLIQKYKNDYQNK